MNSWRNWNWLGELSRPYFGQLTLWVLLICAQPLCGYFLLHWSGPMSELGQRTGPASILSFLPDSILLSRLSILLLGALFLFGALLWLAQVWIPWSGWLTSLSFTGAVALYMENATQATHVAHATNMMLLIHALWYHCYAPEIRMALAEGRFWTTPLYPRWVHAMGVFSLGMLYGLSGLMKILTSGVGWANGVPLQLWTYLWGDEASFFTPLILNHRWLAQGLQVVTLLGETGGFLAIVSRRCRPVIGLLLIGFHIGAISVFRWGFHANLSLLVLFFLPCDRWVPRLVDWMQRRTRPALRIDYAHLQRNESSFR